MREITCARCGTAKHRPTGEVNRAIRNGAPLYCSRECMGQAKRVAVRKVGWYALRFEPRHGPNVVATACRACARPMWLPRSKVANHQTCNLACTSAWNEAQKAKRNRPCVTCGKDFRPRQYQLDHGGGRFCSPACNTAGLAALATPEAVKAAGKRWGELNDLGLIRRYRGEDHPLWQGGPKAASRRRIESGKAAAGVRRYRRENPHKVHEFTMRRKGRKYGRLPYGTIPRIGELQRWKCAICRVGIKVRYHVDHILPLAKGGGHVANNIQLLCPTCNVRKSAKDPIAYMQELGRLL